MDVIIFVCAYCCGIASLYAATYGMLNRIDKLFYTTTRERKPNDTAEPGVQQGRKQS